VSAGAPLRAVHQFVPSFAAHDAVSSHAVQVQALLRSWGLDSEIYAGTATGDEGQVLPFDRFGRDGPVSSTRLLYHLSTGSRMAEMLRARPEPTLVNYHNVTPARFYEGWSPRVAPELELGARQLRGLAPSVDLAIAVSEYNRRELLDAGYRTTAVAPVLVDLDAFEREVDEAALARLSGAKSGGGADLLFVGRVAPHKAQHDLVKVLAVYRRLYDPKARLHLVGGSGSEAYSDAVKGYASALGLGDAVEVTGSVSAGELAAHYRAADVFVCVSEHEGFCVPLLEAMHHRLPIVAFAAAAVPETLAGAGLLLPAKDPATVAAAIDRLVGDADLRAALVDGGSERLTDFALERTRRRFAEAVAPIIEGRT
jgi:glycosyltransferase involved in cell wall biosynthesis